MMQRTIRRFLVTCLLCLPHTALAQGWNLVWQDEFTDGIGPDWVFETGNGAGGWGNNELQYYRRENASIEDGNLVITARRASYGGFNYTSARLKTQGRRSFQYGRIEARIKLPNSMGTWPAFWMLGSNIDAVGWPACGEIDIMEHVNTESAVHGTVHWQADTGNYASYGGDVGTNVTDYHIYAVEWDEHRIRWFMDDIQYHEIEIANGVNGTSELLGPQFLLLNLAIGGNWPGFNIDEAALPARMYVDYVRVYEPGSGTPGAQTQHIEAEEYTDMFGVDIENSSDQGGGLNVGWIDTGDWLAYGNITVPQAGNYLVEYRVASDASGGKLSLDLNGGSTVLGELALPGTGDWQNWTTVSHRVYIPAGTHALGVYAQQGGWNLNWLRLTAQ